MQWYYAKNNEQLGPVDENEFQRLIDTEQIQPTDLVWNVTMENWEAAASIEGLFPESSIIATHILEHTVTDFSKLTLNQELLERAKASLQNNWGQAAGLYFLYMIIINVISYIPFIGSIATIIIAGPFMLGVSLFFLGLARKTEHNINQLFDGFKTFELSMIAYLLMLVFTMLWALLLIIPGIIASLSYSMTYYIIIDNPEITAMDAITRSKEMMMGNKKKYFYMQCRFIGWIILAIATIGIGFIWLTPYMLTAQAEFYEDLKKSQIKDDNLIGFSKVEEATDENIDR
jgi:uncharacterized membrane protein